MLAISGVVDDKYTVLDDEDGVEEPATIEELYLYRAIGIHVEGCHFTKDGLVVDIDGRLCPRGTVDVPEVWRSVRVNDVYLQDDCSRRYEISNYGRLRSIKCKDGVSCGEPYIMKWHLSKDGYAKCVIYLGGRRRDVRCNILVASAFIENVRNVETVNHLDEDKLNNRVDNLEWLTRSENTRYGTGVMRSAVKRCKPVRQYTRGLIFVAEYHSIEEAVSTLGLSSGEKISLCCRRLPSAHTCYGFVWRYAADDELYALTENERFLLVLNLHNRAKFVRMYSKDGLFLAEYSSALEACKFCDGNLKSLTKCCRRVEGQRTHRGYIWRYPTDDEFVDRPENRALIEEFHKRQQQEG